MAKKKKNQPEHVKAVRRFLQDLAKSQLEAEGARESVFKKTSITKSSLEAMIYRGEGGLDAWVELLTHLYHVSPTQIIAMLAESKSTLKKSQKLSEGQILFSDLSDQLSEDKRHFWTSVIETAEGLKAPQSSKKKS